MNIYKHFLWTLDDILANSNTTNSTRKCTMLVKTPHINYKWYLIGCTTIFENMCVVCEKKMHTLEHNYTKITLIRNITFCPKFYVYNTGSCFKISTKKSNILLKQNIFPNTLNCLLNKWSLGNDSRISMYMYTDYNTKHICLKTRDFDHQLLKNWRISNCTDSLFYLEEKKVKYFLHNCSPGKHFECSNGECILNSYICDGKFDCYDKSDELMCEFDLKSSSTICSAFFFRCSDNKCIPMSKLCDGISDCRTQNDEVGCSIEANSIDNSHSITSRYIEGPLCPDDWSLCNTGNLGMCYPTHLHCVFEMSMLFHCPQFEHLRHCETHLCPTMFKCPEMYCIPIYLVCDGFRHCQSGEDERNCDLFKCVGLLRCKGENKCIHPENICDGIVHCKEQEDDETLCEMKSVPNHCVYRGHAIKCMVLPRMTELISDLKAITILNTHLPLKFSFRRHYLSLMIIVINACTFHNKVLEYTILENMVNIVILDLKNNGIIAIEKNAFNYMRKLIVLNLQGNAITALYDNIFTGIISLPILNLSGQFIKYIEGCFCCRYNNLAILNISHNEIYSIKRFSFNNLKLITLDLRFNNIHWIDKHILHENIQNMYFDNAIICCYVKRYRSCISAQRSDINEITCTNILSIKWVHMVIVAILFMLILLNCMCVLSLHRSQLNPAHTYLAKHQLLSNIVSVVSLLFIFCTLIVNGGSHIYINSTWSSSRLCTLLGSLLNVCMLISKLLSFLMVLNQLIATRFALIYRPFTTSVMSFCVIAGWLIFLCIVYLIRNFSSTNNKFCLNFDIENYDFVRLAITFSIASMIFIHDISIVCFFMVIIYHVKCIGKLLDNLQHIESRLIALKRHAFYYCSREIAITISFMVSIVMNSTNTDENGRIISLCVYVVIHSLSYIQWKHIWKMCRIYFARKVPGIILKNI